MINSDLELTPELLLENGFIEYKSGDDGIKVVPNYPDHEVRAFYEKEFKRNLFFITFQPSQCRDNEYDVTIYVQINVGCGFVELPLLWCKTTVGILNHLYLAFFGEEVIKMPVRTLLTDALLEQLGYGNTFTKNGNGYIMKRGYFEKGKDPVTVVREVAYLDELEAFSKEDINRIV